MIIKSKSRDRGTWKQLLNYMERGADDRSIVLTHNLRGATGTEWVQEFREAEELRLHRRKDSVQLYHEVMSFHDEDTGQLTPEKLDDLALEYIRLRAERGLVVAISHHDQEHTHVHFLISGVEHSTGRSMRMSRSTFTAIKRSMQTLQLERYPELARSVADHGRKARQVRSDREHMLIQRTGRPSKREALQTQLHTLWEAARSLEHFEQALNAQGMELYRRNGKPQGVLASGVKYRLSAMGIDKEEIERVTQVPARLEEIQRIRERGREKGREARVRERLTHRPRGTSGELSPS